MDDNDKDQDTNQSEQSEQPEPEKGQVQDQQDLEALKKDLETARGEVAQLHDKWLRAVAELDNYRKRVQKERNDFYLYGNETFARELLPVLDNLERAIEHARESGIDHSILEGVDLIQRQFLSVLEKSGVVPISSLGKEFDPGVHEAVMEEESEDRPPRTIIKEVEKGYMLRNRLLRPSKVVLAKAHVPKDGEAHINGSEALKDKEGDHGEG